MKIIEPKVEEVKDFEGVDNFYKSVARAARICYASDKTTKDKELCERLLKSKHFSPFEHVIIPIWRGTNTRNATYHIGSILEYARSSKYCIAESIYVDPADDFSEETVFFINGRLIAEAATKWYETDKRLSIIQVIDEFLYYAKGCVRMVDISKVKDINTVLPKTKFKSFIVDTSIGCTREMNRHHDNFYICEQSTRYCNFSKDKFGNEVAFNKPYWYDTKNSVYKAYWAAAMESAEMFYMTAIKDIPNDLRNCSDDEFGMGFPIDEARGVLPLDTHTRAIYTATLEEWKHFIDMRLHGNTGKPHGDIKVIAKKINDLIFNKD